MSEKKFKTKDMIIAIFCTILTILCIVFYFLPALNMKDATGGFNSNDVTNHNYSGWEITLAAFTNHKVAGFNWDGLMYIKDVYGVAIILSGVLMPIAILCCVLTTVFSYLSWFRGEKFKKFCFLFSLVAMIFQTVTLVSTWFIALMTREGQNYDFFRANTKGGMAYGGFVSLILVFVIAIIACAYNYFIDDSEEDDDDEYDTHRRRRHYDDEDEDEDDEDEEEYERPRKRRYVDEDEEEEPKKRTNNTKTKQSNARSSSSANKTTTKKKA